MLQRSSRPFHATLLLAAVLGAVSCRGGGDPDAAAGPALATPAPACRLTPLHCGLCYLGEDHVLGDGFSAETRMPFILLAFLVEGPRGEKALIDLGPMTLEHTNAMFRRYGFFRDLGPGADPASRYPDDVVQPHGNVLDQLYRLGVAPADVGHIVFTHLHADHHGLDDATDGGAAELFRNAKVHVSRKGWEENLAKRKDGKWGSYVDYAFGDFLLGLDAAGRLAAEDDATVFPGVETFYLGGHSPCSQAVLVRTAEGPAIVTSDEVYAYRLLEDGILPRIHVSPDAYRAALRRLVDRAEAERAVLIPTHEVLVWKAREERPAAWLQALRPLSDRALGGFRARANADPRDAETTPRG